MLVNTICYKVNTPITFNGKDWHDTFLAYYTYKNDEEAKKEAELLTKEMPKILPTGAPAPDDVKYYFVHKQEEMV